jgi:uncharacterized protein (TIGR00369 family)
MKTDPPPERLAFLTKDYARGFIGDLGLEAVHFERGYLESRLTIQPRHRQQDHYIHAGVLAAMADHTAGYAAFTLVAEDYRILTIEFKINFFCPAFGQGLVCKSRILREGKQILVGESEIFDQRSDGTALSAKALVTLMAVPRDRIKSVTNEG